MRPTETTVQSSRSGVARPSPRPLRRCARRAERQHLRLAVMDGDAEHRVDLGLPGPLREDAGGVVVAGLPAQADALPGEIEIARIAFAFDVRSVEPHDVHEGLAAI